MSHSTPKCTRAGSSSSTKNQVIDLIDPRSPTTAFDRTPIQIILNKSDESDENISIPIDNNAQSLSVSPISSSSNQGHSKTVPEINETTCTSCSFVSASNDLSVSCVDLSSQDISALVSDMSVGSVIPEKTGDASERMIAIGEQLKQVILQGIKSDEIDESISNLDLIDDFSETKPLIKKPMKKLFYTPIKKRSPLVAVDNICPVTPTSTIASPKNVLREKQWKRIQEERKKLGFESDENFQLPLHDATASAPSKLMLRRQNVQNQHNLS